jgi:multidrug efflux pump subunit AcrA (membrane-fusion protein)
MSFAALSLPAVLLAPCGGKQSPADDARVVRTTTVTTDDGSRRSDYSGEGACRYQITAGFRVSGRIAQRVVEVGTRVRRNQQLAKLDAVDAELNVGSARAPLTSVRSEYRQVELDFRRAQRLFERCFSQAELDRDRFSWKARAPSCPGAGEVSVAVAFATVRIAFEMCGSQSGVRSRVERGAGVEDEDRHGEPHLCLRHRRATSFHPSDIGRGGREWSESEGRAVTRTFALGNNDLGSIDLRAGYSFSLKAWTDSLVRCFCPRQVCVNSPAARSALSDATRSPFRLRADAAFAKRTQSVE